MTTLRIGYDSTNAADLPEGAPIYPAYVDGKYTTHAAVMKRFPHAIVPRITVAGGTLDADIIDCETGDATPQHAAIWASKKKARGEVGTIYCNESTWPTVKHLCQQAGLELGIDVQFWIAWYTSDGSQAIPKGAIGRQHTAPEGVGKSKSKGHYDVSSFAAHWPGVDVLAHRSFTHSQQQGVEAAIAFFGDVAAKHAPLDSAAAKLTEQLVKAAIAARSVK